MPAMHQILSQYWGYCSENNEILSDRRETMQSSGGRALSSGRNGSGRYS